MNTVDQVLVCTVMSVGLVGAYSIGHDEGMKDKPPERGSCAEFVKACSTAGGNPQWDIQDSIWRPICWKTSGHAISVKGFR